MPKTHASQKSDFSLKIFTNHWYKDDLLKTLPFDTVESMNVLKGLKAQSLYGEDEVYQITTKRAIKEKQKN